MLGIRGAMFLEWKSSWRSSNSYVSGVYRMELSILIIEQAYLNIQMELVL